jgi:DNA-nicking Smr family endonuclease
VGFHQPFQRLKEKLAQTGACLVSKPCPPKVPGQLNEAALFHQAMQEVVPLKGTGGYCVPLAPRKCDPPPAPREDWEALCCLLELVSGKGPVDLSLTDEYLEGQVPQLDPRVMAALKAGAFPVQEYCDLHGLSVDQAQARLQEFLAEAGARSYRTVLVVHGRGHNSPNKLPVLKKHVEGWLTMKRFRRQVLAFASAQPYDGGVGALYILLRRQHHQSRKKD